LRDYNFFSEYVFSESKLRPKKLILPVLIFIVIASVVGTFFFLEWKLYEKEDLIAEQETFLNSDEVVKTKQELETLSEEVAYLTLLGEDTALFELILQLDFTVTEELTDALLESVPRNIMFTSYSIGDGDIVILGEATERADIAEFEDNLRNLDIFSNIFVPIVSYNSETEHYLFTLEIIQGGELNDE